MTASSTIGPGIKLDPANPARAIEDEFAAATS